jgi:hypothetical protein
MFRKVYCSPWKSNSGIAPSQEDWMWADYHYQGKGDAREGVWKNMIKLSKNAPWIKPYKEKVAN